MWSTIFSISNNDSISNNEDCTCISLFPRFTCISLFPYKYSNNFFGFVFLYVIYDLLYFQQWLSFQQWRLYMYFSISKIYSISLFSYKYINDFFGFVSLYVIYYGVASISRID